MFFFFRYITNSISFPHWTLFPNVEFRFSTQIHVKENITFGTLEKKLYGKSKKPNMHL